MKIAALLTLALLTACATTPRQTVTVTTASGKVYVTDAPTVEDPLTHSDGTRMDWVERAMVKSNGALPEKKSVPVWQCYGADVATTAVGLMLGFAESNPLGLALALPVGFAQAAYAKYREKQGKPFLAKADAIAHCGAAAWNLSLIIPRVL